MTEPNKAPPPQAPQAGWKLVPVEPTPEILNAMVGAYDARIGDTLGDMHARLYRAALAVAPTPPLAAERGSEWREIALKIIEDEERFASTDDKNNIELYALRVARVGTAKQILGLLPMSGSLPAPPVIAEPKG